MLFQLLIQGKIQYITISALIVMMSLWFTGCDDFLTTTPENVISSTEFFKNESQAEHGVMGVYAKLQDIYRSHWIFTEQRSDNTTIQFNDANRGPHPIWYIDEFVAGPSNQNLEPYWGNVYEGIQRANTVLNSIDEIEFSDTSQKEKLIGEAKFLRALFYFHLVRLFGDVPLILKQVQSPDAAFTALEERNDIEEVYDQILNDASEAARILPESYTGDERGRITEGAVRSLLGEIYLTRQNYSDAITEFERVVEIGYSLLPDYADIFDPANKNHDETIFDVNYAELESNHSLGSNFIYQFAPHNSGSEITGFSGSPTGVNIPTKGMLNAYEDNDVRKKSSIGYYINSENSQHGIAIGDTILYVKKFDHPHSIRGVTNNNWPVYRYAHILLMLAESINEMEGPTSEAYNYINQVRARAGLDDLKANLTQSEFRDAVIHEQRVELAFENHRWFHLLRTGRAIDAMTKHGEVHRDIQPHLQEPVYVIEEYKLIYPIPQREMTLNPNLNQNPGW